MNDMTSWSDEEEPEGSAEQSSDSSDPSTGQGTGAFMSPAQPDDSSSGQRDPWLSTFSPVDKSLGERDVRLARHVEEAELARLTQSNELRPVFMWAAIVLVGIIVLTSSFAVVWLTVAGRLTDPIGVGFTVSLGVQVVGIMAIIAHYLFATPESKLLSNNPEPKGQ